MHGITFRHPFTNNSFPLRDIGKGGVYHVSASLLLLCHKKVTVPKWSDQKANSYSLSKMTLVPDLTFLALVVVRMW